MYKHHTHEAKNCLWSTFLLNRSSSCTSCVLVFSCRFLACTSCTWPGCTCAPPHPPPSPSCVFADSLRCDQLISLLSACVQNKRAHGFVASPRDLLCGGELSVFTSGLMFSSDDSDLISDPAERPFTSQSQQGNGVILTKQWTCFWSVVELVEQEAADQLCALCVLTFHTWMVSGCRLL